MTEIFVINIKFRLLFRSVYAPIDVVRRRIRRDDLYRFFSDIYKIVDRTWRDDYHITAGDNVLFGVENNLANAGDDVERLLHVSMSLFPYFFSYGDGHDDQLGRGAGENDFAEIVVALNQILNVPDK